MNNKKVLYSTQMHLFLSANQDEKLTRLAADAGVSKSQYVRSLIDGVVPQSRPPYDFYKVLIQLRSIGTNLNQLTRIANGTKNIYAQDILRYAEECKKITNALTDWAQTPMQYDMNNMELANFFRQQAREEYDELMRLDAEKDAYVQPDSAINQMQPAAITDEMTDNYDDDFDDYDPGMPELTEEEIRREEEEYLRSLNE